MTLFRCTTVHGGWLDAGMPDMIDVTIHLERTTHEFYPSLRDLVLLYDTIVHRRDAEFGIGTGGYVIVSTCDENDVIDIELRPLCFKAEQEHLVSDMENLFENIFIKLDMKDEYEEREQGIEIIQQWIDKHDGQTDVHALYADLMR